MRARESSSCVFCWQRHCRLHSSFDVYEHSMFDIPNFHQGGGENDFKSVVDSLSLRYRG